MSVGGLLKCDLLSEYRWIGVEVPQLTRQQTANVERMMRCIMGSGWKTPALSMAWKKHNIHFSKRVLPRGGFPGALDPPACFGPGSIS
jgi:hypothetical protein